jgi:NADPH2:quinone reductase
METKVMRAVFIAKHGGVEGLEVREVPRLAAPVAAQVLVRVRAAALNRADLLQRRGHYPAPPGFPTDIPGLEFAGEVEAVGAETRRIKIGDRVFGITGGGAQAEYIVVPEETLALVPGNLDWSEAAGVPEAFITAHDALFTQGALKMGESVLVHAAGSGVGLAAVQLARAAGATVFGTSRTSAKLERAREYGLSHAVAVGDDPMSVSRAVHKWTDGAGVNVILDLVGAKYLEANLESLAPLGRLLFVGTTAGSSATLNFGTVMQKRLSIKGTVLRSRSTTEKALATQSFERHVVPLLARGVVRPVIDTIYNLEEIRAAHERLESNASFGKVVLTV